MVVGSVASALHGEPRATLDVDLTLRMRSSDVQPLCEALAEEFFVDPAALRESVRTGIACNAIHRASRVKLDLFVRRNEGIYAEELRRAAHTPDGGSRLGGRSRSLRSCVEKLLRLRTPPDSPEPEIVHAVLVEAQRVTELVVQRRADLGAQLLA